MATKILNPTDDASIKGFNPDTNYGDSSYLNLNEDNGVYIKFDLSYFSSNTQIDSATLGLHKRYSYGDGDIYVRPVTEDWDEDTITHNNSASIEKDNEIYSYFSDEDDIWCEWDVTDFVKDFLSGKNNYGFNLSDTSNEKVCSNDFGTLASKENDNYPIPELKIEYTLSTITISTFSDFNISTQLNQSILVDYAIKRALKKNILGSYSIKTKETKSILGNYNVKNSLSNSAKIEYPIRNTLSQKANNFYYIGPNMGGTVGTRNIKGRIKKTYEI